MKSEEGLHKFQAFVVKEKLLTGVDSMGGTSVRLVGSFPEAFTLAARLLEIPNSFIKTPAKREGAATNGVSLGALRSKDFSA
jgi:hypothetical protein